MGEDLPVEKGGGGVVFRWQPPMGAEPVYLGLGSNLGDRFGFLVRGLGGLAEGGFRIHAVSPVFESEALGFEDQPSFLNLATLGTWEWSPERLMDLVRQVENEAGRSRPFPDAPRTLDVDLLFFGRRILRAPNLRVPHPRWKGRSFVVRPLQCLSPGLLDPETGLTSEEVGRSWPQEPKEIVQVHTNDEVLRALALRG